MIAKILASIIIVILLALALGSVATLFIGTTTGPEVLGVTGFVLVALGLSLGSAKFAGL